MNKTDKIILLFYIFLAVSYTSAIIYTHSSFSDMLISNEVKKAVDEIELVKIVSVDKVKLFDIMTRNELPQGVAYVTCTNLAGFSGIWIGGRSTECISHLF